MSSKWTDEKEKLLRELYQNGYSARQISEKLGGGLTRNAVIGKANRLGLSAVSKSPTKRYERVIANSHMRSKYCQWPIGTPGSSKFAYCGKAVEPGYPYCKQHKEEAYRRKTASSSDVAETA